MENGRAASYRQRNVGWVQRRSIPHRRRKPCRQAAPQLAADDRRKGRPGGRRERAARAAWSRAGAVSFCGGRRGIRRERRGRRGRERRHGPFCGVIARMDIVAAAGVDGGRRQQEAAQEGSQHGRPASSPVHHEPLQHDDPHITRRRGEPVQLQQRQGILRARTLTVNGPDVDCKRKWLAARGFLANRQRQPSSLGPS